MMQKQSKGPSNNLKHIAMQYYNPAINGAVTTFFDDDCIGESGRYFGAPDEALYKIEGDNFRRIRSVHVPYGYSLITYSDENWENPVEMIIGDYNDAVRQKPKC